MRINGHLTSFPFNGMRKIQIDLLRGDDRAVIDETGGRDRRGCSLFGGLGNDTLSGAAGATRSTAARATTCCTAWASATTSSASMAPTACSAAPEPTSSGAVRRKTRSEEFPHRATRPR